jgi:hypothetical protein
VVSFPDFCGSAFIRCRVVPCAQAVPISVCRHGADPQAMLSEQRQSALDTGETSCRVLAEHRTGSNLFQV